MKLIKLTPSQERFARSIALDNATSGRDAYKRAYPNVKSDAAADSGASRTLRIAKVQARIKQLRDAHAATQLVTTERLTERLMRIADLAQGAEQYAAATQAVTAAAKLNGLMVDKIEDVTKRRPALVPTEKTVITESDWLAMVGHATGSHAGNGKAN